MNQPRMHASESQAQTCVQRSNQRLLLFSGLQPLAAALQERLQQLPNLKHLSARHRFPPGHPDLVISLLQSLPPTLQTLLYHYGGGIRGRKLVRRDVVASIPAHMRLIEWFTPDIAQHDTRQVPAVGSRLPPKMVSAWQFAQTTTICTLYAHICVPSAVASCAAACGSGWRPPDPCLTSQGACNKV